MTGKSCDLATKDYLQHSNISLFFYVMMHTFQAFGLFFMHLLSARMFSVLLFLALFVAYLTAFQVPGRNDYASLWNRTWHHWCALSAFIILLSLRFCWQEARLTNSIIFLPSFDYPASLSV